ncbi:autotransporter-associated beta strand repeat-containing protein [Magnetococcales bacterium HHB-1]
MSRFRSMLDFIRRSPAHNKDNQSPATASQPLAFALEPRIMLDAAGALTLVSGMGEQVDDCVCPVEPVEQQTENDQTDVISEKLVDALQALSNLDDQNNDSESEKQLDAPLALVSRKEVVFIDKNIEDYGDLLTGISSTAEIVLIDKDGINQISEYLKEQSALDAIHIVSHGGDGFVILGDNTLSQENLDSFQQEVSGWGEALKTEGDILLYGCNVAESDVGQTFVDQLSEIAGVDVAASVDETGDAKQNGDWQLEYEQGMIESQTPFAWAALDHFEHLLAAPTYVAVYAAATEFTNNTTDYWSTSGSWNQDGDYVFASGHDDTSFDATIGIDSSQTSKTAFDLDTLVFYRLSGFNNKTMKLYARASGANLDTYIGSASFTSGGNETFDLSDFKNSGNAITTTDLDGIEWFTVKSTSVGSGADVGLRNFSVSNWVTGGDSTAPAFENSTPSTSNITETGFDLSVDIDEGGTIYYVVMPDGSSTPTAAEVKAGTGASGAAATDSGNQAVSSGDFSYSFAVSGLSQATTYDVYVVAEDDEGSPNVSTVQTVADVTTTADTTAPTVTSIARQDPSGATTNADNLTFRVTFSEDLDNATVDTADFSASQGDITGGSVVTANSVYDVTVGGSNITNYDGTVNLGIASGNDITDAAGNALGNSPTIGSQDNYTLDNTAPTVSYVSSTNGTYKQGEVIDIRVYASETLTVSGTPQLALETGSTDQTVNYSSGDGSILTFKYTVQSGDTSSDLDYLSTSALTLNGGTIVDAAGNAMDRTLATPGDANSLGDNNNLVIDGVIPTISSIVRKSGASQYTNTTSLVYTVTFSESVSNITTTDFSAAINNGGGSPSASVSAVSASSGSSVDVTLALTSNTFTEDAELYIDYYADSGDIVDAAGNELTTYDSQNDGGEKYDYDITAPTVSSVNSSTIDGTYKIGDEVGVEVVFNEAVSISGTPQLVLETGDTDQTIDYSSGDNSATLTFTYTVQSGDVSSDLNYQSTTALSGTITDIAGNSATTTLPALSGTGNALAENKALVIEGVAPSITSITRQSPTDENTNADSPTFRVTFSEDVSNVGSSDFSSSLGSIGSVSTVTANTVYDVVISGVTSSDGTLDLGIASGNDITDTAGNALGSSPTIGSEQTFTLDNTSPTVSSVTSSETDGTFKIGDTIAITAVFSEAVTVSGTPTLVLETGDTDQTVDYSGGSASDTLTFTYTVQSGDNSTDLDYVTTTSLSGTITDAASNSATLTLATPGNAGSLGNSKALVIDGVSPSVTSATSTKSDGSYAAGEVIPVTVVFSEAVTVSGTPQLVLETGTTDQTVDYASGSGSDTLTFNYTVQSGDTSSDLDYQATTSLSGGTIVDSAGNSATTTLPALGGGSSIADSKALVIDTAAPSVSSVTSTKTDGSYTTGEVIDITVNFSESVAVTGTPQLALETGTTDQTIDYSSGSGSTVLTFKYTVQAGDTAADLDYQDTAALTLNSGTIKDAASNDATLTLVTPGNTNSLGDSKALVIDTTAPTVSAVSSTKTDGSYATGEVIDITVTFNESVTVSGTPQLALETGDTDQTIDYSSGSASTVLTFKYTVQAGDTSSDLDYKDTSALTLNSGTIQDAAGNDATLTLASPSATNSLGDSKALVIDTTAPTLSSSTPSDDATGFAPASNISMVFNENISFSTGDIVLYDVSNSNTIETFDVADSGANGSAGGTASTASSTLTISPGNDLSEATQYAIRIDATAITDTAGNSYAGITDNTTFNFTSGITDSTAPTVLSIARNDPSTDTSNASSVEFTVTFDETVTNVDASDFDLVTTGTLSTTNGDGDISVSGSGSSYTVTVANITGTGTLGLSFNSSQNITDSSSNAFVTAEPTDDELYSIDRDAPTLVSINRLSPTGDITNASSVDFIAVFSEAITDISADDFDLTGAVGTSIGDTGNISVSGSGTAAITVTVSNITGDGALGLDLNSSATINDLYSNALTTMTPSTSVDESYTIDNTAPTSVVITRTDAERTTGSGVGFDIVFSEWVTNVDSSDFELSGAASGAIDVVSWTSGSSFTITLDGTTSGDGSLGLNFASGQNITDAAGNSFGGSDPATDESYVIDNTSPYVVSIKRGGVDQVVADSSDTADVSFIVTFNEEVSGVGTDDFVLYKGSTALTGATLAINPTGSSGKVFIVTASDYGATTTGDEIELILTDDDGITDALSNTLRGSSGDADGSFSTGDAYTINGTLLNEGAIDQETLDNLAGVNRDGTQRLVEASTEITSEIIIIDSRVPGTVNLFDESRANADIWLLDAGSSAIEQITEILADYENLNALHLISHGGNGEVYLGAETLSEESLSTYNSDLTSWGASLSVDGDILLYGCRVAEDATGEAFIDQFAQTTGADVTASNDLTGSDWLGGDWDLEVAFGDIETDTLVPYQTLEGIDDGVLLTPSLALSSSTPSDNATGVSLTDDLTFTFSANVQAGTGNFALYDLTAGGTTVETFSVANGTGSAGGTIAISNDTVTINPNADLTGSNQYSIQIASTAIDDASDSSNSYAGISDNTTLNFTTGSADTTAPTATITDLTDPSNAFATATIVFSESVTGVDISDFTLTKDGSDVTSSIGFSGLSVAGSGSQYTIDMSSLTAASGDYVLTLSSSGTGITDTSSNALSGGASETFTLNTSAPTVSSITRASNENPTDATSVDYTVVFSTGVSGVDTADFTLNDSLTGTSGTAAVSNVTTVSDSVYTVTVNSISGDGTLGLNLNSSGTGITSLAGEAISGGFTGQTYTIDNTAPSVTAITRNSGAETNASSVEFTVSFSEDVTGVDAADFSFNAGNNASTANGTSDISVTGSGSTYTVTVANINDPGTLSIDLNSSGTSITDDAGNAISGGFTSADTYTVDTTAPVVTASQTFSYPEKSSANFVIGEVQETGDAISFSINTGNDDGYFSIDDDGVISLTSTGAGSSAASYDYETGSTSFTLGIKATDAAGNESSAVDVTLNLLDEDEVAPTLSSSTPTDGAAAVGLSDDLTLTFSENIKLGSSGNITLYDISGSGTNSVTIDVTNHSSQLSISNTALTINPTNDLRAGTEYAIQVELGAITDLFGTVYAGISDTTTRNFTTNPYVVLTVDDTTITEDSGVATFTVALQDEGGSAFTATSDVTVSLGESGSTATGSGTDYTLSSGSVTIASGSSSGTVTVTAASDSVSDDSETVILAVDSISTNNAEEKNTQSQTVTIIENIAPTLSNVSGEVNLSSSPVTLDGDGTISDSDLEALNSSNGDFSGASLVVQRSGTVVTSDTFAVTDGSNFAVSGTNLQSSGNTFGTIDTTTSGSITISFTSTGTTATTELVNEVLQNITYQNDTPAGDATILFTVTDEKGATGSATVTVASDNIYINDTGNTDDTDRNTITLAEAATIASSQTGAQTFLLDSSSFSTAKTISLSSAITLEDGVTFNTSNGAGLTITGSNIQLDGTLNYTKGSGDSDTISAAIVDTTSSTGVLVASGAGTLTLSGSNTYSGATTISAGTVIATGDSAIPDTSVVTVSSGATLTISGNETVDSITDSGSVSIDNGKTLAISSANGETFSGVISGSGGLALYDGTLTLAGTNTYEGGTTLSGGTLITSSGDALYDSGSVGIVQGATLQLGAAEAIGDLSSITGVSGVSTIDNGGYTLTLNQSTDTTFSGAITGAGGLTKQSTGTFTLAGSNDYSGLTTVFSGNLTLSGSTAIADAGSITVASGATLLVSTSETIGSLSGDTSGALIIDGAGVALTTGDANNATFSGDISGSGTLVKQGTGTLTLTGANSDNSTTWAATVNSGALSVSSDSNLGGGTLTLNGGTLTFAGSGAIDNAIALGSNDGTIDHASSLTLSGVISGSSGSDLTKTGVGTLTLSGSNSSYGGDVIINSGVVSVASDSNLGSGNLTLAADSTLNVTGSDTIDGAVTLNGDASLSIDSGVDTTFSGVISGTNNGFAKLGAGTLTLTGTNTYTGSTTLSAGLLKSDTDGFASGSTITFDGGTLSAATSNGLGLDSTRSIVFNGGGGTVDLSTAGITLEGDMTGSGALSINASSDGSLFHLGGNNSGYSGAITLNGGTLEAGSATDAFGSGTITVAGGKIRGENSSISSYTIGNDLVINSGSTLTMSGSKDLTFSGNVDLSSGSGVIVNSGSINSTFSGVISNGNVSFSVDGGEVILSGNNTFTDATISSGTVSIASDDHLGSGTLTISGSDATLKVTEDATIDNDIVISGAAGTIEVASTKAVDLSGSMSGGSAFTKTGDGSLTLSGNSSHSGSVTVSAGLVTVSSGSGIGDSAAVTVSSGATLNVSETEIIGSLTGSGAVSIASSKVLTTGNNDSSTTFSGDISGAGVLTKSGSGTFTLSGTNSYSGGTTISAGVLKGTTDSLQGDMTNSGTVIFSQSSNGSYTGVISSSGGVTKEGAGSVTFSGANTYTGETTISAGTLLTSDGSNIGDSSTINVLSGATLSLGASETIGGLTGAGSVVNGDVLTIDQSSSTTFSGDISGTGSLIKSGTGSLTLSGTNTYNSGTTISAGALIVSGGSVLADAGAVTMSGGTFTLAASETIASLSGSSSVDIAANTLTLAGGSNTEYSGEISGSGALSHTGSGTLTLSGTSNSSNGWGTDISSGAISIAADSNLGSGTITISNSGSLEVTGSGVTIDNALTIADTSGSVVNSNDVTFSGAISSDSSASVFKKGSGALTLSNTGNSSSYSGSLIVSAGTIVANSDDVLNNNLIALVSGAGLTITGSTTIDNSLWLLNSGTITTDSGTSTTFSGNIVDFVSGSTTFSANLIKAGDGTLTLSGTNTYSQGTTVNAGTLDVANNDAISSGQVTLEGGTTLSLSSSATSLSNAIAFNGNATINANTNATLSGALSGGNYSLTKIGASTLTLSNTGNESGLTGGMTVSSGVLKVSDDDALAGGTVALAGGSLNIAGNTDIDNAVVVSSDATVSVDGSFAATFSGALSGTATLTKDSTGTLTLSNTSNSSNFTGATNISGGVLIGASDSVFGAGTITLNGSGATLQTTDTSDINNALVIGSSGGAVNVDSGTATYSGEISGDGALSKTGDGTLALTGNNSHSGSVTVSVGQLSVSGNSIDDTASVSVAASASLKLSANETIGTLSGAGDVDLDSYTLTVNQASNETLSGSISGAGGLTQAGGSTLTLSGNNSFSGGLIVSNGGVDLSGGTALADGNSVTINGGTLSLSTTETIGTLSGSGGELALGSASLTVVQGSNDSFAGIISDTNDSGTFIKSGTSTLTLSGTNTHQSTSVTGGTLSISSDGNLGSGTVTLSSGSTLEVTGSSVDIDNAISITDGSAALRNSSDVTLSGNITGTGSLYKSEGGGLNLSGTNSYDGLTVASGTVTIDSSDGLGSGTISLSGGTTLAFGSNGGGSFNNAITLTGDATIETESNATFSGVISDGGSGYALTKTGSYYLTLTGTNNTYGGTTTISSGSFSIADAASLGSGQVILTNNATFQITDDTTMTNAMEVSGSGVVQVSSGKAVTFSGALSGSGSLSKTTDGSLTLSGTNTHSGAITINGGVVTVANGSAFGDNGTVTVNSAGTLNLSSSETVGTLSGSGTITLNSNTLTINQSSAGEFSGGISGSGSVIKQGTETLTLSGTNTYTGTTTVSAGALVLDNGSAIADSASVIVNSGSLSISASETVGVLNGSGGTVDLGSNTLTMSSGSDASYAGTITGTGTLGVALGSSATYTLTGTSNNSSGWVASLSNGSTLSVGADSNLGSGTVVLNSGTLLVSSDANIDNGIFVASGGGSLVTDNNVTFSGQLNSENGTYLTLRSETGSNGTFTLSGSNNSSGVLGEMTVSSATLQVAGDSNLGAEQINLGAATLTVTGSDTIDNTISIVSGSSATIQNSSDVTFSGNIMGSTGSLVKDSGGDLTLSGANSYNDLTVASGTVTIDSSSGLGSGTISLSGGTTLAFASNGGGTFNNAVTLTGDATIETESNATFSGVISDGGSGYALTKTGSYYLTLTGTNNTYGGTTTISSGSFSIADAASLGSGQVILTNNATFQITDDTTMTNAMEVSGTGIVQVSAGKAVTFSGALSGSGSLSKTTEGSLTLSGTNTHSGAITINGGVVTVANGSALGDNGTVTVNSAGTLNLSSNETIGNLSGSGAITLNSNTLTINQSSADEFSGGISGSGSVIKQGSETLTLSGTNTYTGTTTVSAGALVLDNGSAIADSASVIVNSGSLSISASETVGVLSGSGGTVDLGSNTLTMSSGSDASYAGTITGTGTLGVALGSSATYTLTGTSNSSSGWAASLTNGSTLSVASDSNLGSGSVLINDGTLQVSADADIDNAISAAGSGGALITDNNVTFSGQLSSNSSTILTLRSETGSNGTFTLSGTNSSGVFGEMSLSSATVKVAGDSNLGGSQINLSNTTLEVTGSSTIDNSMSINSASTIDNENGLTLSNVLAGSGSLTKTGGGDLTLSGTNTHTGDVTISTGTVTVSGGSAIGDAATVTVDGGTTFSLATDETVGLITGAGTVEVQSGVTFTVGGANDGSFTGNITGAGNLIKVGTGSFTLSGSNDYTGTTTVSTGTLIASGGTAISDSSAVTVSNSATLSLSTNEAIGSLSGAGSVNLQSNTLTVNQTSDETFFGGLSGSGGSLVKQGGSTLTLAGSSSYDGTTTISSGTLRLIQTAGVALSDNSDVSIASGASLTLNANEAVGALSGEGTINLGNRTLTVNQNSEGTFSGGINGTGGLTVDGSSTLTLSGTNTHTGTTYVSSDVTVILTGGSAIADNGAVVVDSPLTLVLAQSETIGTLSGSGEVNLDSYTLTVNQEADAEFSGGISGSGSLIQQGSATLTLSGSNTFSGGATLTSGGLTLSGGAALHDSGTVTINGGTFTLNSSESIGTISGSGGSIALGSSTLTVDQGDDQTFSGDISGATGSLSKTGSGKLTLSGTNSLGGTTTVSSGTLSVTDSSGLGSSSISAAGGTTLEVTGSSATFSNNLALSDNSGAVIIDVGSNEVSFSGNITETGSLNKVGDGTLTLSGTNSYSGTTTVSSGTLSISSDSPLGSGALTLAGGTTLNFSVTADVDNSITLSGDATVDVDSSSSATLSGTITDNSGTYGLTKTGSGTLTLSGTNNSYTGLTDISAGSLIVGGRTAIDNSAAVSVGSDATFSLNNNEVISALSGEGDVSLGSNILTIEGSETTTFSGNISGASGGLTLSGSGELTLSGTNTYNGITEVFDAATLNVTGGSAIADDGAVIVGSSDTFVLQSDETIGSLSGTGSVNLSSFTLTTGDSSNTTFSGVMSGSGGLIKQGSGDFTLSGSNSYSGDTTISAGTLIVSGGSVLDDAAIVTVESTGTLQLSSSENIGGITGSGAVDMGANTFTVSNASDVTFSGSLSNSDSGQLIKSGSGNLTLAGSFSLSSSSTDIMVDEGTLTVDNTVTSSGGIEIASGGTLGGGGTISGEVDIASGGTLNAGSSPGKLTISDLTMVSGATFTVEINGSASSGGNDTAGTNYDQVVVTNSIDLGSATFNPVITTMPDALDELTIIDFQGSGAISGTFDGLSEDNVSNYSGGGSSRDFQISYVRGTGNDVQFIANTTPTGDTILNDRATASYDYEYELAGYFSDSDGESDTLTFSSDTIPDGLELDAATGTISGKPTQAGIEDISITVTDLHGLFYTSSFTLTIAPAPVDDPMPEEPEPEESDDGIDYSSAKADFQETGGSGDPVGDSISEQYAEDNGGLTGTEHTGDANQAGENILANTVKGNGVGPRYDVGGGSKDNAATEAETATEEIIDAFSDTGTGETDAGGDGFDFFASFLGAAGGNNAGGEATTADNNTSGGASNAAASSGGGAETGGGFDFFGSFLGAASGGGDAGDGAATTGGNTGGATTTTTTTGNAAATVGSGDTAGSGDNTTPAATDAEATPTETTAGTEGAEGTTEEANTEEESEQEAGNAEEGNTGETPAGDNAAPEGGAGENTEGASQGDNQTQLLPGRSSFSDQLAAASQAQTGANDALLAALNAIA